MTNMYFQNSSKEKIVKKYLYFQNSSKEKIMLKKNFKTIPPYENKYILK